MVLAFHYQGFIYYINIDIAYMICKIDMMVPHHYHSYFLDIERKDGIMNLLLWEKKPV